jgi:hypothetical protein
MNRRKCAIDVEFAKNNEPFKSDVDKDKMSEAMLVEMKKTLHALNETIFHTPDEGLFDLFTAICSKQKGIDKKYPISALARISRNERKNRGNKGIDLRKTIYVIHPKKSAKEKTLEPTVTQSLRQKRSPSEDND